MCCYCFIMCSWNCFRFRNVVAHVLSGNTWSTLKNRTADQWSLIYIDDCSRPISNECIELYIYYIYLLLQPVRKILQQLQFKHTYVVIPSQKIKVFLQPLEINTCIIAAPLWMYCVLWGKKVGAAAKMGDHKKRYHNL